MNPVTLQTAGLNVPSEARGKLTPPWIVPMAGAAHTSGGSHPHSGGKTRPIACRPRPFTDGGVGLSSRRVRESRTTALHCRRRKYSAPAAVEAVVDAFAAGASVSARGPTTVQRESMPGYTRPTSSGGSCRICRSKSRGRGEGALTSAGAKDPGILRLCPTLETRIMDLRQDNTAFAQFLSKVNKKVASVEGWRQTPRTLVYRNRIICGFERPQFSSLRREESAAAAQRRREGNRERRRCMEQRRSAIAEASRSKYEGPSRAEKQTRELLKRRRQRFFLAVVFAVGAILRLRSEWEKREILTENITAVKKARGAQEFEASLLLLQGFFRSRKRRAVGTGGCRTRLVHNLRHYIILLRRLKDWIQKAGERWKNRRRGATVILREFLRDARLFQNIAAIHSFRRKVVSVTRARLELLDLFYQRCEERLRGELVEGVRQEVRNEVAADLEIHRQMLHPPGVIKSRRTRVTKKVGSRAGAVKKSDKGDIDLDFMEMVMKIRLKSAVEELETRVAHPVVKRRLLDGLLVKVRFENQTNMRLAAERRKHVDRHLHGGMRKNRCPQSFGAVSQAVDGVFTIADARQLLSYRPHTPHFPAAKASIEADKEGKTTDHTAGSSSSQAAGNDVTRNSFTGAPCSPDAAAAGAEPLSAASGYYKGEERHSLCEVSDDAVVVATTSSRVQPMLLLKAVSESMSQLVLAAWEQSLTNGTSRSHINVEKEGHTEESGN